GVTCVGMCVLFVFFFSSRRRHTRSKRDWSSDVCSSDLCIRRMRLRRRGNTFCGCCRSSMMSVVTRSCLILLVAGFVRLTARKRSCCLMVGRLSLWPVRAGLVGGVRLVTWFLVVRGIGRMSRRRRG